MYKTVKVTQLYNDFAKKWISSFAIMKNGSLNYTVWSKILRLKFENQKLKIWMKLHIQLSNL